MSILFIAPTSGLRCPQELENINVLSPFEIFMESGFGIEEIFDFRGKNFSIIKNDFSHLFIDPDRNYKEVYPLSTDGVIKSETDMGKEIYKEGFYPDELAISNILKRYYFPFLKKIKNFIEARDTQLIINCKSQMAIYPKRSEYADKPTPVVQIGKNPIDSHRDFGVLYIAEELGKKLSPLCESIGESFKITNIENSYLFEYFNPSVPVIEITLSKSLYINDRDFNLETREIRKARLEQLSGIVEEVFSKFYGNIFKKS